MNFKIILSILFLVTGCNFYGDFTTDGSFTDESGTKIEVLRKPSHPYLAEYERKIRVILPDGSRNEKIIFPDTGGTVQINVYQKNSRIILLRDRIHYYSIDSSKIEQIGVAEKRIEAKYLGCFDKGDGGKLNFFLSSQRAETDPPGMMKD